MLAVLACNCVEVHNPWPFILQLIRLCSGDKAVNRGACHQRVTERQRSTKMTGQAAHARMAQQGAGALCGGSMPRP